MKSSPAKELNGSAMTTPSGDIGAGASEAASSQGISHPEMERVGPAPSGGKHWTGGYDDYTWLGDPSNIRDRQWADHGGPGYFGGENIAWPENEVEADIYMVPDFQGASGQGANQSTMRPIGSV
jgi:hypothetical protein